MITSKHVKNIALGLGADLCGIAPIERFADAPRGFHPCDLLPETQSVVVVATHMPEGTMQSRNMIPYTVADADCTGHG